MPPVVALRSLVPPLFVTCVACSAWLRLRCANWSRRRDGANPLLACRLPHITPRLAVASLASMSLSPSPMQARGWLTYVRFQLQIAAAVAVAASLLLANRRARRTVTAQLAALQAVTPTPERFALERAEKGSAVAPDGVFVCKRPLPAGVSIRAATLNDRAALAALMRSVAVQRGGQFLLNCCCISGVRRRVGCKASEAQWRRVWRLTVLSDDVV